MSYSRSSFSQSRYGSGYSRSSPVTQTYEGPITTGTTDEILDLRRQIKHLDRQAAAKTRGRYHWTNIRSGTEITNEFNRKYPSLHTSSPLEHDTSFPYPMIRPPPAPPASTLCYSNLGTSQYTNASYIQPQRVSFQTSRAQSSHHHHHHYSDDDSFDESSNNDDERIRKALQHIDHASRILENY